MRSDGLKRRQFTLVELLVVMVIISILASLLFPALQQALNSARHAACTNNYKQIGLALSMYADANGDFLPGSSLQLPYLPANTKAGAFTYLLNEYLQQSNNEIWFCPANGRTVWQIDNRLFGLNNSASTNPAYFFGKDDQPKRLSAAAQWKATAPKQNYVIHELCMFTYVAPYDVIMPPHNRGYNELYFDGHIELRNNTNMIW